MANTLPTFGDISTIIESSEGASLHEQFTERFETHIQHSNEETQLPVPSVIDVDSQETQLPVDSQETQIPVYTNPVGGESQNIVDGHEKNGGSDRDNMEIDVEGSAAASGDRETTDETQYIDTPGTDSELLLNQSMAMDSMENEGNPDEETEEQELSDVELEPQTEAERDLEESAEVGEENDDAEAINIDTEDTGEVESAAEEKLFQLPISKIRKIMQIDPDTNLISKEALAAIAISTENFIAMLAQQSSKSAIRSKKKRITMEHFRSTVTSSAECDFLEGTLPEFEI